VKAFDDGEGSEILTAHYDTDGGVRLDSLASLAARATDMPSWVANALADKFEQWEGPATPRRQALMEAADLIDNDRNAQYGEPSVNLGNTRDIFQVLFPERQWTAADVARAMVAVKLARSVHQYKRDTGVDLLGWAAIYVELEET
jgi:hypothetical protein